MISATTEYLSPNIKKLRLLVAVVFLLLVAVLNVPIPPAHAEPLTPTPQQLAEYQAAPEGERLKLLVTLANTGKDQLAERLLGQFPFSGPLANNRTLFIQGLILRARGKLSAASEKFRKALANDPKLTMVRAELAKTLVAMDETDSAKHHLELLIAESPNMDEANKIKSFIQTLSAKHPFTFTTYVSLAPSSNINNGSNLKKKVYENSTEVKTSRKDRKKSGVGLSAGFNAGYTKRLDDNVTFVSATGTNVNAYTHPKYNTYAANQSLELRHRLRKGYVSFGVVASATRQKDLTEIKEYRSSSGYSSYYAYGPRFAIQQSLTPKDQITSSFVYEKRHSKAHDLHISRAYLVNAGWQHLFSSSFGTTLTPAFERVKTEDAWNDYKAYAIGLGLYKELPHGITANLYGGFRYAKFDEKFVAPYNRKRHDNRYTGAVTLTKRDWNIKGYAPSLNYTYIFNDSNLSLYHYDSNSVDFRLTKNF